MDDLIIYENNSSFNLSYSSDLIFTVPKELNDAYEKALKKWEQIVKKNSTRAKPFSYHIENNSIHIIAGPFSYIQTRAWQECLSGNKDCFIPDVKKEISSLSLTVAVISHDGLVSCALRSPKVSRYPNTWSVGLGEGLEDDDFRKGSLNESVKRGLKEELNISFDQNLSEDIISYPAISFNKENSSVNILAVVNFSNQGEQYSSQKILDNFKDAPDAWEHTQLLFVEPSFESFEKVTQKQYAPGSFEYFHHIIKHIN